MLMCCIVEHFFAELWAEIERKKPWVHGELCGNPVDALRETGLLSVVAVLYAVKKSLAGNAWW